MKTVLWFLFATVATLVWAESAQIQVRQASVYEQPSVLSPFLGKVAYGDQVTVLGKKNGWVQISSKDGLKGWTRQQGLTSGNVVLKAGTNAQGASDAEVSLAGRGFTDPVETQYRQDNPQLSYATLDAMEKVTIPDDQLNAFLKDGGLNPGGGQ